MIKKEECGIFLCYDALLALLPIIIILAAVTNIQIDPSSSNLEMVMFHQAQDTLDLMSVSANPLEPTTLEQISSSIEDNNPESANKIANNWLKNKVENRKYRLVEVNQRNGQEICSSPGMDNTKIVAVAVKSYKCHMYKLYFGL
jgi:hypothetical protein